ncbi:MAG TPA: transglutaminase domain-containing protein [Candidatus Gallacutalibacter stercoravium]|nr:transglutaminase domain-containing protein [Candidatus Gallacutalibacter stercoravium]
MKQERQKVITGETQKRNGGCSGFDLLFLLTAAFGLVLLLRNAGGVRFQLWAAPLAALPGALLWYLRRRKSAKQLWAAFFTLAAGCLLPLCFAPARGQIQALLAALAQAPESEGEAPVLTGAVLFFTTLLSLAVFLLELVFRIHWPMYLATTLAMLAAPFLGMDPGLTAVFLFFAFQVAFWVMNGAQRKGRRGLFGPVHPAKGAGGRAAVAAALVGVFFLSLLAVGQNAELFYQAAYRAEGFLQRTARQISGTAANPVNGAVSRGNLYPAGTAQLEVRSDRLPTETLYLRGFSGGDYAGGEWLPNVDDALLEQIHEGEPQTESRWLSNQDIYEMYFFMNVLLSEGTPQYSRTLSVRLLDAQNTDRFVPYFGRSSRFTQSNNNGEETFHYYQSDEMAIDWNNFNWQLMANRNSYYETQEQYAAMAKSVYTTVPEDQVPRLAALCEANPQQSLQQITAFILYTLQTGAAYTRTPGLFPVNADPVEHFLFEGHAGYCQHFASTAVLMYRLYGIPARYAAGYAVSPSAFTRQEDGTYLAVVTDESAHAWPEIFLEDYGWVPVEVTPAVNGTAAEYLGMDAGELEAIFSPGTSDWMDQWNFDMLHGAQTAQTAQTGAADSQPAFSAALPDAQTLAVCALYAVFFLGAAFLIYRMSRLRRIERMDIRALFSRIVKAVAFAGAAKEALRAEEDLALRLPQWAPGFTGQQAGRLLFLVQEAAFGPPAGQTPEEAQNKEDEVRGMYRQIVGEIYQRLPFWKKPAFKYGKTFL